jgi:hypothetical protein
MGTPRLPALAGLVFADDKATTLEIIGVVAGFAAAIGAGVAVFVWARNWRRQLAEESTTEEPIETYQLMLDEGLIDPQEFDRIQARLHRPPDVPAEPPSPDPPSENAP